MTAPPALTELQRVCLTCRECGYVAEHGVALAWHLRAGHGYTRKQIREQATESMALVMEKGLQP